MEWDKEIYAIDCLIKLHEATQPTRGISIENCKDVTMDDNIFEGLDEAISAKNSEGIVARRNIVKPSDQTLFLSMLQELRSNLTEKPFEEKERESILDKLSSTFSYVRPVMDIIQMCTEHLR